MRVVTATCAEIYLALYHAVGTIMKNMLKTLIPVLAIVFVLFGTYLAAKASDWKFQIYKCRFVDIDGVRTYLPCDDSFDWATTPLEWDSCLPGMGEVYDGGVFPEPPQNGTGYYTIFCSSGTIDPTDPVQIEQYNKFVQANSTVEVSPLIVTALANNTFVDGIQADGQLWVIFTSPNGQRYLNWIEGAKGSAWLLNDDGSMCKSYYWDDQNVVNNHDCG